MFSHWRPDHDGTVVEKLAAAGAILLGKLHMTEFALRWRDFAPQPNVADNGVLPESLEEILNQLEPDDRHLIEAKYLNGATVNNCTLNIDQGSVVAFTLLHTPLSIL